LAVARAGPGGEGGGGGRETIPRNLRGHADAVRRFGGGTGCARAGRAARRRRAAAGWRGTPADAVEPAAAGSARTSHGGEAGGGAVGVLCAFGRSAFCRC